MRASSSVSFFFGLFASVFVVLSLNSSCTEDTSTEIELVNDVSKFETTFQFVTYDIVESMSSEVTAKMDSSDAIPNAGQDDLFADSSSKKPIVYSTNQKTGKQDEAFLVDANKDGLMDTLYMASNAWVNPILTDQDVYIYGNGGCFNGKLEEFDLVKEKDGYYQIDFSQFIFPCAVELSLISSIGTDGKSPTKSMSNWYWWQNARVCGQGSPLCELKPNGYNWEEWLIRVWWIPQTGLQPDGNGFTKNSQLK